MLFRKYIEKPLFHWNLTRIIGTLHGDRYKFMITSRSILLRMRHISDKFVEEIKTNTLCSKAFLKNRAFYEITWKNIVQPDRPQMTIRRMRIACCITKSTYTHSEYVTLNAFSTATTVTRTGLGVTLHGRGQSCYLKNWLLLSTNGLLSVTDKLKRSLRTVRWETRDSGCGLTQGNDTVFLRRNWKKFPISHLDTPVK